MPFAGYIRGAVELAHALVAAGWAPVTTRVDLATMMEAYPGGAWPTLAGGPLPHKTTPGGRKAREALLQDCGVIFPRDPATHDECDAALCALLGVFAWRKPAAARPVGVPVVLPPPGGWMREGVIMAPNGAWGATPAGPPQPPHRPPEPAPIRGAPVASARDPLADWLYFATPTLANRWDTVELAIRDGVLCCPAHNSAHAFMPNVQHVTPGQTLLLAYGTGIYEALAKFRLVSPATPVPGAPALDQFNDPAIEERLRDAGYKADSVLKVFTGFVLELEERLPLGISVTRPGGGRNSLHRGR